MLKHLSVLHIYNLQTLIVNCEQIISKFKLDLLMYNYIIITYYNYVTIQ